MMPSATPSKRRTASLAQNRWIESALPWHSRQWWRMPLTMFLCIFVVHFTLETSLNHPIRKTEVQQNATTVTQNEVPADNHLQNQAAANKLWADRGINHCRFPAFFDIGKHRYSLSSSSASTASSDDGWINPENWRENLLGQPFDSEVYEQTNEYHQMLIRKQYSNMSSLEVRRNITFVHVGKAGGSSVGCHLAAARRYVRKHCDNRHMPVPLSALSMHVNCYTHWQGHMYCYDTNDSFLVNVRNPIQRMASWFLYEHVQNHPVNYAERDYHCGDLMLYSCYETWDQLASIGLEGPQPPINQRLRVGANLTQEECSHWAWAAAMGNVPASYHNVYNYEWYANRLFRNKPETTEIFVLRAEHFQQDWTMIDRLLGGTASFPASMQSPQNSATKKKLRITDSTASPRGIRNLCRAMCKEIQIYKNLLAQAVNLEIRDVNTSMEELRQTCPDEAGMSTRDCDTKR